MQMGCEKQNKIGAYLDRELPETERASVEAHLSACSECSAELARLQRLKNFLVAARMPQMVRPRAVFEARMNSQRVVRFAEYLMAAAAIIIVVCTISLVKTSVPDQSPVTTATSQPVQNWERMALSLQPETTSTENEDPMVQVLLRDQP
jgi:anti-sigma factor RsiW